MWRKTATYIYTKQHIYIYIYIYKKFYQDYKIQLWRLSWVTNKYVFKHVFSLPEIMVKE